MTEDKNNEVTWETCFNCKYSSSHDGMLSCAWKSGRYSCLRKCDKYERDWASTIITGIGPSIVFIFPILLVIYLILCSLGVLK